MQVTWDPEKAAANQAAHGVSFAEAATVLEDEWALTREDPDAIDEQRFATLHEVREAMRLNYFGS